MRYSPAINYEGITAIALFSVWAILAIGEGFNKATCPTWLSDIMKVAAGALVRGGFGKAWVKNSR